MADILDKTELTSLSGDEAVYVVDGVGGSPTDHYMQVTNLLANTAQLDVSNTFTSNLRATWLGRDDNTDFLGVTGGDSTSNGANIRLYGGAHTTYPKELRIRSGGDTKLTMDNSGDFGINTTTPDAALKIYHRGTGTRGLRISTLAGNTQPAIQVEDDDTKRWTVEVTSSSNDMEFFDFDNGTASYGPRLMIGRNSNGTNPVPGSIKWKFGDNSGQRWLYPDNSGVFRTQGTSPQGGNSWATAEIVGAQTSTRATKDIRGPGVSPDDALATLLQAPVYEFTYKRDRGRAQPDEYHGIVTDDTPELGWDEGRHFNAVNAAGYTIQAIKALAARIEQLETQLTEIGGGV